MTSWLDLKRAAHVQDLDAAIHTAGLAKIAGEVEDTEVEVAALTEIAEDCATETDQIIRKFSQLASSTSFHRSAIITRVVDLVRQLQPPGDGDKVPDDDPFSQLDESSTVHLTRQLYPSKVHQSLSRLIDRHLPESLTSVLGEDTYLVVQHALLCHQLQGTQQQLIKSPPPNLSGPAAVNACFEAKDLQTYLPSIATLLAAHLAHLRDTADALRNIAEREVSLRESLDAFVTDGRPSAKDLEHAAVELEVLLNLVIAIYEYQTHKVSI
ncbi:hypothetical protein HDU93_008579 [Gonapodya sp. JEL0774]|nr:hypothetical protein HDU93_008579 [Gonapodya sp. JEL0774]